MQSGQTCTEEAIQRIEKIEREIVEIKRALANLQGLCIVTSELHVSIVTIRKTLEALRSSF